MRTGRGSQAASGGAQEPSQEFDATQLGQHEEPTHRVQRRLLLSTHLAKLKDYLNNLKNMTEVKAPLSPEIGANTAGELSAI